MSLDKRRLYYCCLLLCLASLYILAWHMQTMLLLKDDVGWLMHLSRLVLNGKTYLRDFFETNPPLIFYLYMPTIAISKLFSLSDPLALRLYVFLLSVLSLYICYDLAKKIFPGSHLALMLLFTFSLGAIFLILPIFEFGQREHLFIILSFPYLLLTSYRLQHPQHSIPHSYAIVIGFMAALGFAIKPFFLVPFLLVTFYYLCCYFRHHDSFHWHDPFACLKPETLTVIIWFILYANLLFNYYPAYVFSVIPITAQFYYQTIGHPWHIVLCNFPVYYICCVVMLYYCFSEKNAYTSLGNILLFALIGNFLSYAMQKLSWYYHLMPALALALMLQILLLCHLLMKIKTLGERRFFISPSILIPLLLSLVLFFIPIHFLGQLYGSGTVEKNKYSSFISYLNQEQRNTLVYFLSARRSYMTFIFDHGREQHYPRLEYLGWMLGYFRGLHQVPIEPFFVKITAEDLNKNQPQLIFVDQAPYNTPTGRQTLNCLRILMQYNDFKLAWVPYHYLTTIEQPSLYKFDIYERQMV